MRRGLVRFSSGGAILALHSLTTPDLPSAGLANIPLEHFAGLVYAVRRVARIVPLAELLEAHRRGQATGGAVAISFDDAYASLLSGLELLRSEQIPITVFVAVNAARKGATYWWDRIDDLFPFVAPDRWSTFECELGIPVEFKRGQPPEFGPLRPLRQWILAQHCGRWPEFLEPPIAALEKETGVCTVHRSLTFEELATLASEPMVEFGVHTLSHPVLPLLSPTEFQSEVGEALRFLQERLPRVQPILAIPFGLFDGETARRARDAGMTSSLTLAARTLRGYGESDSLPRFGLTHREPAWKLVLRVTGVAERLFSWRLAGGARYPALPSATT